MNWHGLVEADTADPRRWGSFIGFDSPNFKVVHVRIKAEPVGDALEEMGALHHTGLPVKHINGHGEYISRALGSLLVLALHSYTITDSQLFTQTPISSDNSF